MRSLAVTSFDWLLLTIAFGSLALLGLRLYRVRSAAEAQDMGPRLDVVIDQLRAGLESADSARIHSKRAPLLSVKEAEVEVSFVLKRENKNDAEAQLHVVTLGTSEGLSREQVHKLKVTFVPAQASRSGSSAPQSEEKGGQ